MNLSQIIAKDSYWDEEIPDEGHYSARIEIVNGRVDYGEVTKKKKKVEKIKRDEQQKEKFAVSIKNV